jgi:hypothetical protein
MRGARAEGDAVGELPGLGMSFLRHGLCKDGSSGRFVELDNFSHRVLRLVRSPRIPVRQTTVFEKPSSLCSSGSTAAIEQI